MLHFSSDFSPPSASPCAVPVVVVGAIDVGLLVVGACDVFTFDIRATKHNEKDVIFGRGGKRKTAQESSTPVTKGFSITRGKSENQKTSLFSIYCFCVQKILVSSLFITGLTEEGDADTGDNVIGDSDGAFVTGEFVEGESEDGE
eukprot:jgi/Bigna1/145121/aug1.95_g19829